MKIEKKLKSGAILSSKLANGSSQAISICNAHSIYISGNSGTVEYRKSGFDTLSAIEPPAEALNGWADGPIWQQTDIGEIIITATGDCDVIINSYVDGK